MRFWKITIILLILLVATQIPFCWRRVQLSSVNSKINQLNALRIEAKNEGFRHYQGVIHVHTGLGGHSRGNFDELISAAQENKLDFVLLTEHPSPLYDTAQQTLNGRHGGVLFVGGNEVASKEGDRFLILPGDSEASKDTKQTTNELLTAEKKAGRLVLITYPNKYQAWETAQDFDGSEVYSLHTDARKFPQVLAFFDFFWSFPAFPELTIARFLSRPDANLQKYDELTANGKRPVLFGACDAHSNIGVSVSDRANHDLLKIQIDPYQTVFHLVRLHVWLPEDKELNQENLLEAIKMGHCYLGFDVFGDASEFVFRAENDSEKKISGDEIALGKGVKMMAQAAQPARFVLFKTGEKIREFSGSNTMNFEVHERGVYRVEVYLDSLQFTNSPWIVSNPIYVR